MLRPVAEASAEMIRSRQNGRLKDLRRRMLHSNAGADGLIAIEGDHLLQEAVRGGLRVDTLFLREDRADGRRAGLDNALWFTVAADAFNYACATESPQGIAALIEAPRWSLDDLLRGDEPLLVVLAGLQDPGNVGTIVRAAEAFGASGVLLTPGSADPWNQKVLRASAGSIFRLPVVALEDAGMLRRLGERKIPLYACVAKAGESVVDCDLRASAAFVIGNEGAGIPAEIFNLCSSAIHIPCPGPVESLNAAMAASIVLYEAARQRTYVAASSHGSGHGSGHGASHGASQP